MQWRFTSDRRCTSNIDLALDSSQSWRTAHMPGRVRNDMFLRNASSAGDWHCCTQLLQGTNDRDKPDMLKRHNIPDTKGPSRSRLTELIPHQATLWCIAQAAATALDNMAPGNNLHTICEILQVSALWLRGKNKPFPLSGAVPCAGRVE